MGEFMRPQASCTGLPSYLSETTATAVHTPSTRLHSFLVVQPRYNVELPHFDLC